MPDRSTEIEAAVFRRLLDHLRHRTDVQNIDLMVYGGFCRNCFAKWYKAEAENLGIDVDADEAREIIYGMPYDDYKAAHQTPATDEQMARMNESISRNKR